MSDEDYEVGYKRPPKSGQFKPGQSGNPKGRPKGQPTIHEAFARLLRGKIRVKKGGTTIMLTRLEALGQRILDDALRGDPRATDQVLKLLVGTSSGGGGVEPDGTEPDMAADIEALKELFRQHDVDPDLHAGAPFDDDAP